MLGHVRHAASSHEPRASPSGCQSSLLLCLLHHVVECRDIRRQATAYDCVAHQRPALLGGATCRYPNVAHGVGLLIAHKSIEVRGELAETEERPHAAVVGEERRAGERRLRCVELVLPEREGPLLLQLGFHLLERLGSLLDGAEPRRHDNLILRHLQQVPELAQPLQQASQRQSRRQYLQWRLSIIHPGADLHAPLVAASGRVLPRPTCKGPEYPARVPRPPPPPGAA
ncbi:hypothetical protein KRP22_002541 [Phytophthora ramorum]